ncbi:hypothetical protein DA2_1930 [Desulfovibrio sp. A2]|nr:hypothetical protein DA2_1930 [Desulfovibrio sp. A2]
MAHRVRQPRQACRAAAAPGKFHRRRSPLPPPCHQLRTVPQT